MQKILKKAGAQVAPAVGTVLNENLMMALRRDDEAATRLSYLIEATGVKLTDEAEWRKLGSGLSLCITIVVYGDEKYIWRVDRRNFPASPSQNGT